MILHLHPSTFNELPISNGLKKSLTANGFINLKPIQSEAIPHLLAGRNVLGASPTGSGKTLAFLVPVIELLTYSRARPEHGTIAIILSPSRELAQQTYSVANDLIKPLSQKAFPIIGGQKGFNDEAYQLRTKGQNLLIATPGRLRQHLEGGYINLQNFQFLVIDEADRMLEAGFENDLYSIFSFIKKPRQIALFSATLTADVEGLMKLNISSPPIFCILSQSEIVTTLEHCYSVVELQDRVAILASLLKRLYNKRIVVFVGARKEAEYLARVFNAIDIDCDTLHGDLSQSERSLAFVKFNRNETHILIATNVASRGLDFPDVDWSISLGPPDRVTDYVHRAGRTARNEKFGQSLLLLAPNEVIFASKVRQKGITIKKIELHLEDVEEMKQMMLNAIEGGRHFTELALEAVLGFENTYRARPAEEGISIDDIDMNDVRISFGLEPEGKSNK
ncbi:DEAD-box ATP-dependent RNA helicase 27-like [Histomonas meleagridis]|uniref:DEAD-box ATP-dependent RNA helicase 27-like n=1 Tax=Histomonas meleagridis TaxID=135588 RepID=UPI003559824F|nr:DEAD-box ATP-dependent RNA helicase 27-like [Histomonas meleagridis]KAH0799083.1 DEAD-box ATP-dependent RNA helicase 27-like [Histomonas meleagridis]